MAGQRVLEVDEGREVAAILRGWKLITTSMFVQDDKRVLCETFEDSNPPSKNLQADIHDFDRVWEDDPRHNLRWMTESMGHLLQRSRVHKSLNLQQKRV